MRLTTTFLILAAGVALSVAIWMISGGRFVFFFLPLVFGLPMLFRRNR